MNSGAMVTELSKFCRRGCVAMIRRGCGTTAAYPPYGAPKLLRFSQMWARKRAAFVPELFTLLLHPVPNQLNNHAKDASAGAPEMLMLQACFLRPLCRTLSLVFSVSL
jgi:hypothetical protein